jgi:hypothetical protein
MGWIVTPAIGAEARRALEVKETDESGRSNHDEGAYRGEPMTQGVGPSGLSWADGLWVVPGLRVRRQVRPGTTGGAVPVFTTARRAADYLARLSRDGLAVLHVPPAEVGATLAGFVERGESRLVIDPRQADARTITVAAALAAVSAAG